MGRITTNPRRKTWEKNTKAIIDILTHHPQRKSNLMRKTELESSYLHRLLCELIIMEKINKMSDRGVAVYYITGDEKRAHAELRRITKGFYIPKKKRSRAS